MIASASTSPSAAASRRQSIETRAESLFEKQRQENFRGIDRLFVRLMLVQWVAGIVAALWISPYSWAGTQSQVHLHVWLAVLVGGAFSLFPVACAYAWPATPFTRYTIAVGQMMTSALLIHLTGGRNETHFHVFGSLVILSFYRDWRVLVPATLVVAVDHFVRGIYWPYSAYGLLTASPWRSLEHAAWVIFEDVFLVISCLRGVREMRKSALQTAAVEESEERFRQFAEHIESVFWMRDPRTNQPIYISPAYAKTWGRTPEEFYGAPDSWLQGVHEEDRARVLLAATTKQTQGGYQQEYRIVRPDGSVRWIRDRAFPIRDEDGTVYRVAGIAEDITEQRSGEDSLRLQTALLEAESESSIDGILVVSSEGRILSFNRRFVEMWELPLSVVDARVDEAALQLVVEKVAEPELFLAKVRSLYGQPDAHSRDELTLRDGRTFDRYSAPVKAADGTRYGRIWFFRDVTMDKRAAEALRGARDDAEKARMEAERANMAKSEFLSRMSHELRTPLNAILGFGQLLQLDDLPEKQAQSVQYILKGGRHLLGLINEVLDIARIEAGKLEFSLEAVAVAPLIEEAVALVTPLALARSIKVKGVDESLKAGDLHAFADVQRIKQVILNLLSNAIKYNVEAGTVTVACRYLAPGSRGAGAEGAEDAGHIRIAITDTGHGITQENLQRLFTPFDRLGAENGEIEGSGIGLALSKRLMESMNGTILVESQPGRGSTFSIEIPAAAMPKAKPLSQLPLPAAAPHEPAGPRRQKILQIEDNLANRLVMERLLERRGGIELLAAMQGQLGLDLAREHRPDLILLDLHLPDLPGAEVFARIKADVALREIPVVVISADATEHQRARLLAMGARGYLTKPFDVSNLMQTLDDVLRKN